jgi:hypothetical protein
VLRLCALIILTAFTATACRASLSERDFAEDMLARLSKVAPERHLRIKEDEPLVIESGKAGQADEGVINLHRIFGFCVNNSPKDCDALRQEFVAKITIRPPDPTLSELRMIVRDRQYVEYIRSTFEKSGVSVPSRQIGDDLYVVMAFDSPQSISVANDEMLTKLGLTTETAWQTAMHQTAAILPPLPDGKKLKSGAVAFQEYEYLASLLADLGKWELVARDAGPDMFVTAVSDGFVFVGIMPDGPKLEGFRKTVADDCSTQPRCVSPNIYRFRNGRWVIAP